MNQQEPIDEPRRITWSDERLETRLIRPILGELSDAANRRSKHYENSDQSRFYYSDVSDEKEFGGLIPFFFRFCRLCAIVIFWATTGACTYALFYKWMMPRVVASKGFSFDYGFPNQHNSFATGHQLSNSHSKYPWELPNSCSQAACAPLAKVDLFARHNGWEAMHESVIPLPITERRVLQPHRQYYIDVALELPESKLNRQAGVFGLVVILSSSTNNTLLAKAQTSSRFPFESAWVSLARKVCLLPALLLGAMHESRMLYQTPFRFYMESLDFPIQYATIMLTTKSSTHFVEVAHGAIIIGEEMNIVQEVMKEYYYTCFLLGTIMFMGMNYLTWKSWLALNEYVMDRVFAMQEPPCDLDLDGDDEFFDTSTAGGNFDDYPDFREVNVGDGGRSTSFRGDADTTGQRSHIDQRSNQVTLENTQETTQSANAPGESFQQTNTQPPRPSSLSANQNRQDGLSFSDIDGSEEEWEDL